MKTFQIKFKTILFLLMIGLAFTSCRDGKEEDATSTEPDQVNMSPSTDNDGDATNANASKNTNSSIIADSDATSPDSPEGNTAPITLDCNYFKQNPNSVLKDNPDAAIDYIITCVTRIDGKLTIEPGVVIAFDQDAGMEFKNKSSFKMEGTAEKPIILTGKEKTKGFWRGIHTESSYPNNIMSYVTIDYAGGMPPRGGSKAALAVYRESSNLTLDHCTFSNSKNTGMVVNDKVGKDVNNIIMKNCTFTKNNIPVQSDASRLRMYNGTNSFSGNENDYVFLDGGNILGDATWVKLDVPYLMKNPGRSGLKVKEGELNIEPGTEIIMAADSGIEVSSNGSLLMVGTAEAPIVIRGERDVPGYWNNIYIGSNSPLNEIAHVNFKNAGRTTGKPNGVVQLGRSTYLNLHDVVFSDCFEYGVSFRYGSDPFHFKHDKLALANTPKLFSNWSGKEVIDPNNP